MESILEEMCSKWLKTLRVGDGSDINKYDSRLLRLTQVEEFQEDTHCVAILEVQYKELILTNQPESILSDHVDGQTSVLRNRPFSYGRFRMSLQK